MVNTEKALFAAVLIVAMVAGCGGLRPTPPASSVRPMTCDNVAPLSLRSPSVYSSCGSTPDPYGVPSWDYGYLPGNDYTAIYFTSGPGFSTLHRSVANNIAQCAKENVAAVLASANALIGSLITNASKWSSSPYAPNLSQMIVSYNNYWRPLGGFTSVAAATDFIVAAVSFLGPAQTLLLATAVVGGAATLYLIIDCAANKKGGVFG